MVSLLAKASRFVQKQEICLQDVEAGRTMPGRGRRRKYRRRGEKGRDRKGDAVVVTKLSQTQMPLSHGKSGRDSHTAHSIPPFTSPLPAILRRTVNLYLCLDFVPDTGLPFQGHSR